MQHAAEGQGSLVAMPWTWPFMGTCLPLQVQGVAADVIKKLQDAGYHTVDSVAHASMKELTKVKVRAVLSRAEPRAWCPLVDHAY